MPSSCALYSNRIQQFFGGMTWSDYYICFQAIKRLELQIAQRLLLQNKQKIKGGRRRMSKKMALLSSKNTKETQKWDQRSLCCCCFPLVGVTASQGPAEECCIYVYINKAAPSLLAGSSGAFLSTSVAQLCQLLVIGRIDEAWVGIAVHQRVDLKLGLVECVRRWVHHVPVHDLAHSRIQAHLREEEEEEAVK